MSLDRRVVALILTVKVLVIPRSRVLRASFQDRKTGIKGETEAGWGRKKITVTSLNRLQAAFCVTKIVPTTS